VKMFGKDYVQVWCEDECLAIIHDPGREQIGGAWPKRYGQSFDRKAAIAEDDGGDGILMGIDTAAVEWRLVT
jgi:hypothetical protein